MFSYYKYQCLGNDFILFDWTDKTCHEINNIVKNDPWISFVHKICNRRTGIGADGVLITRKSNKLIEGMLFNSDGSDGVRCLNGTRCIAYYLHTQKQYNKNLKINMGNKITECFFAENNEIVTNAGTANYKNATTLSVANKKITGHIIDVGNPHFVIFNKTTIAWLKKFGGLIEKNKIFSNGTNVEFVWLDKKNYNILIFERGCGITKSCGTGAVAVIQALYQTDQIKLKEMVKLKMPGGIIESFIDNNKNIIQIIANSAIEFTAKAKISH